VAKRHHKLSYVATQPERESNRHRDTHAAGRDRVTQSAFDEAFSQYAAGYDELRNAIRSNYSASFDLADPQHVRIATTTTTRISQRFSSIRCSSGVSCIVDSFARSMAA